MGIIVKIPVKEAIISGEWLEYSLPFSLDYCCILRLRPILFEKILSSEKDNISTLHPMVLDEGVLWLLKIEVINLSKTSLDAGFLGYYIALHDKDDFVFNVFNYGRQLVGYSVFSNSSGLSRFALECRSRLQPKIKIVGALAFLLPDDDEAEYFLSASGGSIQAL